MLQKLSVFLGLEVFAPEKNSSVFFYLSVGYELMLCLFLYHPDEDGRKFDH